MTDTSWPREADATIAVEAAAKAQYDALVTKRREIFPPSVVFPDWDDLDMVMKRNIKDEVLVPVWAALSALPDPRYTSWLEGLYCGLREGYEDDNPYPEPEPPAI